MDIKKEVVFAARVLYTVNDFMNQVFNLLDPVLKTPLNSDNLLDFMPIFQVLTPLTGQLRSLGKLITLTNDISKKLWTLNREFALKFGEDPIYLQDPAQITALIQNIPDTLKREVMQRIISSDLKTTKMDVFNDLSMPHYQFE